jgi:alanine dehydrogenase
MPDGVDILTSAGFQVVLESGAGKGIGYADVLYAEAGAQVTSSKEKVFNSDVIIKVLPPSPAEASLLKQRSILFSMMDFGWFEQASFEIMLSKKVTAFAYEFAYNDSSMSPFNVLLGEMEGNIAIDVASSLMAERNGRLLGQIAGSAPTVVVVLGSGIAAGIAAVTAASRGALVKVFDSNIKNLQLLLDKSNRHVYTSVLRPSAIRDAFSIADVVVGAMDDGSIIADDMLSSLKDGVIVVDLRISSGGSFETTCGLRAIDDCPESFKRGGVLYYCQPHLSNRVPRTASQCFSNILIPLLQNLLHSESLASALRSDIDLAGGVYLYLGKPVKESVSRHFNVISNDLGLYLSI